MTHDAVQRWIDAYVDAWRTYDPAAIEALFAEDATYAYHPYDEGDEVVRGREAIVTDWLEEQDKPGTWEASYRPLVVEGQRAVAEGTTCGLPFVARVLRPSSPSRSAPPAAAPLAALPGTLLRGARRHCASFSPAGVPLCTP